MTGSTLPASFRESLPDAAWARLGEAAERVALEANETVMRRGDPPEFLYVVETGTLVVVDPRTSPATVLTTRGAGHIIGEMSFLDGTSVSAEVRAEGPTTCWRFAFGPLEEALRADPTLDAAFHRALARTLGQRTRALTTSAVTGGFGSRARELEPASVAPGPSAGLDPHLAALLSAQESPDRVVPLTADRLRIGRDPRCEIWLRDPHVDPFHAELVRGDDGWRVVSTADRAVVVRGSPVASAPLAQGASVGVGRTQLRLDGAVIHATSPGPVFALHVAGLHRTVRGRALLHDVSFTALAGEVIALVGPSGSGKTTLLSALSGTAPADSGQVRVDGERLADLLLRLPSVVGEVPQDDIVLPELTVEESLAYAARLRLPRTTAAERNATVNGVLTTLGLDAIRASRIGDPEARGISGGQRKRVNIGQEILTDATRLLFLDEPTSGLDPKSAEDIARLARRLADSGRIVVLVTHDLSDGILAQVDQLLVMAAGGHLAWFGPVDDALDHFDVASAAKIFDRLADHAPQVWAQRYRASMAAARFVTHRSAIADASLRPTPPPTADGVPGWGTQWWTLTRRVAKAKLRDRTAVAVLALQPLLVAAVIQLVFPEATAGLIFLLSLASFWFGMSAAVRELIADRVVWRRERRIGVAPSAWVLSKAGVLALTVGLQCIVCTAIAAFGVGLGPLDYSAARLVSVMVLTGWTGAALGLWVSTLWRRSDAAVGTIVLLLVPQIAFVGMLTPLDQLGRLARAVAWATPLRYAFHLALVQGERLKYLKVGEWHERPVSGELFLLGLRPAGEGALGLPATTLIGVLVAFIVVLLAAAIRGTARERGR